MRIVLVHPEIPQNTGNIIRTCAVTGAGLTVVEPCGFALTDRNLKRAGLDYEVDLQRTDTLDITTPNFTLFSAHATTCYTDIAYSPDHLLIFGSETCGLPEHLQNQYPNNFARIPVLDRCLNLSNAVAIALYEAWRQQGFHPLGN